MAQEPSEAVFPSMPRSAVENVDMDYVLPAAEMPALLTRLANEPLAQGATMRRANGKPFPQPAARAYLLVPAGARGPSFLMTQNFRAIMKYNPAEAYAMAIGHLADRLRGGDPFVQAWPRHEPVLTLAERREMQELLNRKGFNTGEPNGRLGAKARAAVRDYQSSVGLVPDGFASATILARLRGR